MQCNEHEVKCNHDHILKRFPYKNEKVAATMQQLNMYARTGGDKVAN